MLDCGEKKKYVTNVTSNLCSFYEDLKRHYRRVMNIDDTDTEDDMSIEDSDEDEEDEDVANLNIQDEK